MPTVNLARTRSGSVDIDIRWQDKEWMTNNVICSSGALKLRLEKQHSSLRYVTKESEWCPAESEKRCQKKPSMQIYYSSTRSPPLPSASPENSKNTLLRTPREYGLGVSSSTPLIEPTTPPLSFFVPTFPPPLSLAASTESQQSSKTLSMRDSGFTKSPGPAGSTNTNALKANLATTGDARTSESAESVMILSQTYAIAEEMKTMDICQVPSRLEITSHLPELPELPTNGTDLCPICNPNFPTQIATLCANCIDAYNCFMD